MINLKFSNTEEPFYNVELDEYGNIYYRNENNQLHNLKGPAIDGITGYKVYYVNGKPHRIDGPAIESPDGYKAYYIDGKRHRLDGPAVIYPNGSVEYWINDKQISKEEFDKLTKRNNND